ncbi:MAG: TGS domain-containing protein [Gaiellaceae bacterium]
MDCGTEDPRAHKALAAASTVARIWGPWGRFAGQRVGRGHLVAEGDVVEVLS